MPEEKQFFTLQETAKLLGVVRSTIYPYMRALGIVPQRYGRDKRKYLTREQVEQIRLYRKEPWKFPEKKGQEIRVATPI